MDSKLLAAGAEAHHKAIQGVSANGVCADGLKAVGGWGRGAPQGHPGRVCQRRLRRWTQSCWRLGPRRTTRPSRACLPTASAQMDSKLLAAGAEAHHKAIQGVSANG